MIRALSHAALRLDVWLQARLGRPYNALLGVGLTIELINRLRELPEKVASMPRLAGGILVMLMEAALLIHQVGALSHHIGHPRGRRRQGGGAKAVATAGEVSTDGE